MANRTLTSIEIPQADSLENVRRVVEAIANGSASRKEISDKTLISVRHIDYAIHAAKSLGFLAAGEAAKSTDSGRALAATGRGSAEEADQFRAAIKANSVIQMLAPELLDDAAPSKAAVTERIQKACPDLSEATAARRAQTLLAWRAQALAGQISSPNEPEAEAEAPVEEKAPAKPKVAPKKAAKPAAKKAAPKKAAKPAAKKAAPKKAAKPAAKKAAPKKAAKPAAKKAAPKKVAKPAAKKAAPKKVAKPAAKKAEKGADSAPGAESAAPAGDASAQS
ncbi:MAG: hypothetical protein IPK82_39440 [Polyangiaceae bacterium]|nr:hypothetical protein [Polyangiaceae bacterium]